MDVFSALLLEGRGAFPNGELSQGRSVVTALRRYACPGIDVNSFAGPAWRLDVRTGRVVEANASGSAAFNGALREGSVLDRAMPALGMLRKLSATGATGSEQRASLLFWTTGGPRHITCRYWLPELMDTTVVVAMDDDVPGMEPHRSAAPPHAAAADPAAACDLRLATLAHELRTPLSAIAALAEVIKDRRLGPMADGRYHDYARDIYETSRHALSVIGAMLEGDDAGGGALPPLEADLAEVAGRCLSATRELAVKASITLSGEFTGARVYLDADQRSLMQIIFNLLSNALQFTPPGGAVTVATCTSEDGSVALTVCDTGAGMTKADIDRLLGEDSRAFPARPGTSGSGYGLPLVKALARASDARIEIRSSPDSGTCVSVIFPKDRVRVIGP